MGEILTLTEAEEFETIPDGEIAQAEVISVEKSVSPFKDNAGNPKEQYGFRFKILSGSFKGRQVWGNTSTAFSTHPDCRLRAWVQEILGDENVKTVDTDTLVNQTCRIVVSARAKKAQDGSTTYKNYVSDVIRASQVADPSEIF